MSSDPVLSRKAIIMIGAFLGLMALAGGGLKFYENYKQEHKPEGNYLEINGLGLKTFNKPKNQASLDYIKKQLYLMVSLNSSYDIESESISDFNLRTKSFSQDFNESSKIHTVSFVVDSKELKQSYAIKYQWPGEGFTGKSNDLEGKVRCVDEKDIIFEDFRCKDVSGNAGWAQHPIFEHLILQQPNFEISQFPIKENTLYITIKVPAQADGYKAQQEILDAKNAALNWIRSVGYNPSDFIYEYR